MDQKMDQKMDIYDLIVVGAGPGGYTAAVHAGKAGLKTLVIEKEEIGGVCLNYGCIPTKFLLNASNAFHKLAKYDELGIKINGASFDFGLMISKSRGVVSSLKEGINFLFQKNKVQLVKGVAKIEKIQSDGLFHVSAYEKNFMAKNVILATGSNIKKFNNIAFSSRVWSSKQALTNSVLPKSIAIIGAGAIGMEFANFYSNLGVDVSVLEYFDTILNGVDREISATLQKSMKNIKFYLGAKIDKISESDKGVVVSYGGNQIKSEVALVSIGVTPNYAGFEQFVNIENGCIATDFNMQTKTPGLFAIGDCVKGLWLAHKAMNEAVDVVDYIISGAVRENPVIPICIYTSPQIACVGPVLEKNDPSINIAYSYFFANGKALCMKESAEEVAGFAKFVFDKNTDALIAAHMIGPEVTELIHSISLGIKLECLAYDLQHTVFPHPTLSEIIHDISFPNPTPSNPTLSNPTLSNPTLSKITHDK